MESVDGDGGQYLLKKILFVESVVSSETEEGTVNSFQNESEVPLQLSLEAAAEAAATDELLMILGEVKRCLSRGVRKIDASEGDI